MNSIRRGASLTKPSEVLAQRLAKTSEARRSCKRRRGFTLIELVISITIASIIALSLTMLLNQSYASQKKLDSLTQLNERATLFFTQLERDLMGATIPIENILALEAEQQKKSKDGKPNQPQNAEQKKENGEKNNQAASDTKKTEEPVYKPFDRVFYYNRAAQHRFFFSWITRNPLQLHWGSSVGAARPRIARVMYRLEQDQGDKTLFKLIRSEGLDLTYTPYEKHTDSKCKGSVIIDGVKNIKVTCVTVVEKKEEQKKDEAQMPNAQAGKTPQKKEEKPPVTEVKTLDQWEWPLPKDDKQKDDKKAEELPPLPQGVRIELVLWDAGHEREVTFEYGIYIPALPTLQREKKNERTTGAKQEEKKTDATPKAGNPTVGASGGGSTHTPRGGSSIGGSFGAPQSSFNAYSLDPNARKMVRIPS